MNKSLFTRIMGFIHRSIKDNPNKRLPRHGLPHDFIKHRPTRAFWNSVEAIVDVLEARDAYTAYHSKHVARLTLRMCIAAELSPNEIEKTLLAAISHDLGKVGIADAALKKNGPLTEQEWNEIKRHPDIGANLVQKAYGLTEIAEIIRHHHERWDGKGYPNGLRGEEIPRPSRIIALCDSTDAMMTRRVYREKLTAEVCMEELRKNSGIMYDPDYTELFLRNWDYITKDTGEGSLFDM